MFKFLLHEIVNVANNKLLLEKDTQSKRITGWISLAQQHNRLECVEGEKI